MQKAQMPGKTDDITDLDAAIVAIRERLSSLSSERCSLAERMERINQNLRQIRNVKTLSCYQCRSQLSLGASRLSVQSGSSLASSVSCTSENGFGLDECDDASSDCSSLTSAGTQVCYRHRRPSYKSPSSSLKGVDQLTSHERHSHDLSKIPEVHRDDSSCSSEAELITSQSATNVIALSLQRHHQKDIHQARSDSCLASSIVSRRSFCVRPEKKVTSYGWRGSTSSVLSINSRIRGLETAV